MSCHSKIRFNRNSVLECILIAVRDGKEVMDFECGDCGGETHDLPPVSKIHNCQVCSKPILIPHRAIVKGKAHFVRRTKDLRIVN
jgi:hypothetical protein